MYKPKVGCNEQLVLESKLMKKQISDLVLIRETHSPKKIAEPPAHEK
jgi:hypothetical protein